MSDEDKRRAPKLEDYVVDVGLPAERVARAGTARRRRSPASAPWPRVGDLVTLQEPRQPGRRVRDDRGRAGAGRAPLRGRRRRRPRRRRSACGAPAWPWPGSAPARRPGHRHHAGQRRPGRPGRTSASPASGTGAGVKVYDSSAIVPAPIVDHLVRVAEEREIPHQIEVMTRGGTDTRELQLSGRRRAGRRGVDPHPLRAPGGRDLPPGRSRRLRGPGRGLLRDRAHPGRGLTRARVEAQGGARYTRSS